MESELRRDHRETFLAGRHARETLSLPNGIGEFFTVKFFETRLVVKEF